MHYWARRLRVRGRWGASLHPVIVLFFYESNSPRNCFSALAPFFSCGAAAAAEGLGEDRGEGGARVRCRIKRRRRGEGGGSFNPRGEIFRRSSKPGFWIRRRSRIRRQRAFSARQQTALARARTARVWEICILTHDVVCRCAAVSFCFPLSSSPSSRAAALSILLAVDLRGCSLF